jgi:hypothetical protein
MGQLVGVVEKRSSTRGVVRFELNRSLSGMGHERFSSVAEAAGHTTPSAILARLLFATDQVASVHVYANIVTVDIKKGHDAEGLAEIVAEMYRYWKPGVQPPSFDDLQPDEPAESAGAGDGGGGGGGGGDGGGGDAELSEAAKRVPSHLLERSRAARERWKAKQG